MKDLEIIILIVGIILVLGSLFMGKKKGTKKSGGESADAEEAIVKIKEAAAFQETELKRRVREIIEEQRAEILSETEERLSRISNDKIIAVDEFSNQVLEKIENNNQEVIFLYDMFQKKEEEMKSAMNKLERARRENKELLERLEEADKAKEEPDRRPESPAEAVLRTQADGLAKGQAGHKEEAPPALPGAPPALPEGGGTEERKRREQVLALYQRNKNMREISKQLSMGQGEVQLIIDLYGKGKG